MDQAQLGCIADAVTWFLWLTAVILLAVAGFSIYSAFRSPAFWIGLARALLGALLPAIGRALHYTPPRTPEEVAAKKKQLKDLWGRGDK